ncbi:MAG: CDP-glucose 4,6-dehydratase [Legionella sp.]|nr:CDP-glucose 4,6-dehydratase [Legionella sp.]
MKPSFWKDKTVLITGHTGFKGSWLSLWLQQVGAKVIGFSLDPPSEPNLFTLADVAKNMIHIHGDIRKIDDLKKTIIEHQPDIVFHMAAQSLVQHSYQHPLETYETNVLGTIYIFETLRCSKNTRVIINVTSDKCYENLGKNEGYCEHEALGGYDPYSNSKACADLVGAAFRRTFSLPIASVRAGNVIGGGDWANNRLIPDVMRAFMQNKPIQIRHTNAIRPWQFVLEPLDGYLILAEKLWDSPCDYTDAWNFGPSEEDVQPVQVIVERLIELWGEGASWVQDKNIYAHEAQTLRLNILKAKTKLGWSPKLTIHDALGNVVNWYKAWRNNQDVREVTLKQIETYMQTSVLDKKSHTAHFEDSVEICSL